MTAWYEVGQPVAGPRRAALAAREGAARASKNAAPGGSAPSTIGGSTTEKRSLLKRLEPPGGWGQFVVWDGFTAKRYEPDALDCIELGGGRRMPVQSVWSYYVQRGFETIVLFACRPGERAYEEEFGGRYYGVFSWSVVQVLRDESPLSTRAFIVRVNTRMAQARFAQNCEAVCRPSILDLPFPPSTTETVFPDRRSVLLQYDICRTPSKRALVFLPPLRGCLNDMSASAELAAERFGSRAKITILGDSNGASSFTIVKGKR